jgi:hypothetical protein
VARPQNSPKGVFAKQLINLVPMAAVPAVRHGPGSLVFVTNSTGSMVAINTTGTTWTYLNVTSVLA